MKALTNTYSLHFKDKRFVWSLIFSVILLLVSLYVSFHAGAYATRVASQPVTDIILSNIPVYDVDNIFIYGPWVFWILTFIFSLSKPRSIPFAIKNIALFLLIRSIFISLTHIGPFPTQNILADTKFISVFTSGGDLFFSAHTGLPFLMALVFWEDKILRVLFILTSIFFGIIVLMGHLHYSIDVFAAFFITYAIYHIAGVLFKKDKKHFEENIKLT